MAGRGLGVNATTDGAGDPLPVPSNTRPAECVRGARVAWEQAYYGDDADARVLVADEAGAGLARALLPRLLSQDEDELTPTQKLKRPVIEQHFAELLNSLYPVEEQRRPD